MRCVICGKALTFRFFLCSRCEAEFGRREDWPPWLKFLVSDEWRRRTRSRRELALADMIAPARRATEITMYGEPNTDSWLNRE